MKLEVLLSTMNRKDYHLVDKMNLTCDCILINQCGLNSIETFNNKGRKIKVINSNEKGLSKSRNLAINNSNSDICLIADDDMVYKSNLEELIINEFNENIDIDILLFEVDREEFTKKYPKKEKKINHISSMKFSSIEIAFRRKSIANSNIKFNELLGSGSIFTMGEENEFLNNCLNKGLKIKFIPICIGTLRKSKSTWFKGYNENYFKGRGGSFEAISDRYSNLLIFQFAIRKYKLYKNQMNFFEALKCMWIGKKEYRKYINKLEKVKYEN